MFDIAVEIVYTIGLTLGVGSSTFALIFYILALEDGVIDASERRFMHTVYFVLRLGMAFLLVALLANTLLGTTPLYALAPSWVLMMILILNAVLMTYHIMPMQYGPIFAGGSWYSLFIVSTTPFGEVSYLTMAISYPLFLVMFYGIFSYIKNKCTLIGDTFRGDVVADAKILETYATDASSFKILPKVVYYPKTVSDIVALIQKCRVQKKSSADTSITLRAGGTCMSGGPLNTSWIMDMTKHMNKISIDAKRMTATVEMGAYFRDIEDAALKHNLLFAAYPSSHRLCGIGGMLGNNASGEKSLRSGATVDNVLELEVVLADGTVKKVAPKPLPNVTDEREKKILELHGTYGERLREAAGDVSKSASGYRLEKTVCKNTFSEIPLFVGAQGTLGIITKAVLKLMPIPIHTELLIISGQSLKDIPAIIDTVMQCNPEGLETFDGNTFTKAKEHLSASAEKVLPYIDEKSHLFILAQFSEKTKEATKAQAIKCFELLQEQGYYVQHVVNPHDVVAAWEVRRNSFLLMRDYNMSHERAVPCIEDVIVPLSALGEFITKLSAILKKRKINFGYHGHIGEGSLRIIPIFDFTSPTVSDEITGLMHDVFALIKKLKGNISADHSDGIIRSPFLKEFYGEELYGVFEEIKHLYDPQNILNPYKKVGGSLKLMDQYLHRIEK